MQFGELKPILSALALPPAAPLLLVLLGLLWAMRRRAAGITLAFLGAAALWLLSCNAVAVLLARNILPQVAPVQAADLQRAQAIVVLGGGVLPEAPEYGAAQPGPGAMLRIRYGAWLARTTGKPLAYAGGVGWGAVDTGQEPEGTVARRVLQQDFRIALRWTDDRSLDTQQNAERMAELMRPDKISRVALVTDAWHMPRATYYFRRAGFDVIEAPTGFAGRSERPLLEWLPSSHGLVLSRQVLREWLALQVARIH